MACVLLVEDDTWMAECYALWLRADEHQVTHSRDAQDALDVLDQQIPDVIVLDLFLPFANGIQMIHTLRSHADLAQIPIIVCSSALTDDVRTLAKDSKYTVLDKTALTPHTLRRAVKEAT